MNSQTANRGVYTAERASALSGVPESTVYEWARNHVVSPSVSRTKVKLWSWTDLVALRAVYWLRHSNAATRPATPMAQIRSILGHLRANASAPGEALASGELLLAVDGQGRPYLNSGREVLAGFSGALQIAHRELVTNLLDSFSTEEGTIGPDLLTPRARLRIVPGKLSGEPHVIGTRIESRVLAALRHRGFDVDGIARLYPDLVLDDIRDALSLEGQLLRNLRAA